MHNEFSGDDFWLATHFFYDISSVIRKEIILDLIRFVLKQIKTMGMGFVAGFDVFK